MIFEKLLEIKANRFPSSYNITDYKVNRSHYYRLSIIDLDGFVKYSNIVFITLDDETLIRVLPNPAKDIIQVEIGKSDFEFVISNTMGQHVKIGKSEPFRDISIQELPVGVYFLTIEGITQRFIKQ
ncbi:MAG: T9SS type A sorting domain-containing protein [Saprospiraceae bacterium]|nr:T9SS type A sorting domain-containing protein [Saprospiraceae bacterium]